MPSAPIAPAGDEVTPPAAPAQKKKFYGRTAKVGAAWSIIRQGGLEIIQLPASMLLARLLGPADFGIAAAASFFIVLSTRLTQLGFNSALVRIKTLRPEHTASVFVVSLALGFLTCAALIGLAPLAAALFGSAEAGDALRVAACIFLITPFGTVPSALIARSMQFRQSTIAQWTDSVVGVIVSIALAVAGFGFWAIVLGHLVGTVGQVSVLMYLSRWRPSVQFSRAATSELLNFGLGIHLKRLLQFACMNLDTLVVGSVLGVTPLGFYDKAFTLMNRIVVRLAVGGANFRIFSIIQEDAPRFRRAYVRLILTVSLIALPAFGAVIAMAPTLFAVLFGEDWLPSALPFQILCIGGVLRLYDGYASQANEALGGIWSQVRRQAVGAILVGAGAWAGSHLGGIIGAAVGVTLALAVLSASMQTLVRKLAGLSWREMLAPQIPGAVCAAGVVLSVVVVEALIRALGPATPAWQMLIAQAASGALSYSLYLVWAPFPAVRELVRESMVDLGIAPRLQSIKWLPHRLFGQ